MAGRNTKTSQRARSEAERARIYTARAAWHEGQIQRRVRDNTIAVIAGVLLVGAAIASQVIHAQVAAPAPEPTQSSVPTPAENPFSGLLPTQTPAE